MKLTRIFVPAVVVMAALVTMMSRVSVGVAHGVGRHEARSRRAAEGPVRNDGQAASAEEIDSVAAAVERALDRHGDHAAEDMKALEELCRAGSWSALEEVRAQEGNEKVLALLEAMGSDVVESYMGHWCEQDMDGEQDLLHAFMQRNSTAQTCLDVACAGGMASTLEELGLGRDSAPSAWAIEEALRRGHTEVIELLFEKGVVRKERSRYEKIHVTRFKGNREGVLELLRQNDLDPEDIGVESADAGQDTSTTWICIEEEVVKSDGDRHKNTTVLGYDSEYNSLKVMMARNRLDMGGELSSTSPYDIRDTHVDGFLPHRKIHWFWLQRESDTKYEVGTRHANDACGAGQLELVMLLAARGVDASRDGADRACDGGHAEVVAYLISQGIEPTWRAMRDAGQRGDLGVVKVLVEGISDLRTYSDFGANFANMACMSGSIEVMKYLVGNGVRPNAKGADLSCGNGDIEMVKYLVENGIRPSTDGADMACVNGDIEMVKYLVEHGIRPSTEGADLACGRGDIDMMAYLIGKDIRPSTEGLNKACKEGNVGMVGMVMGMTSHEVKPDHRGANEAWTNGDMVMLRFLAEHGVEPRLRRLRTANTTIMPLVECMESHGVSV